jgi:hypothetical protein
VEKDQGRDGGGGDGGDEGSGAGRAGAGEGCNASGTVGSGTAAPFRPSHTYRRSAATRTGTGTCGGLQRQVSAPRRAYKGAALRGRPTSDTCAELGDTDGNSVAHIDRPRHCGLSCVDTGDTGDTSSTPLRPTPPVGSTSRKGRSARHTPLAQEITFHVSALSCAMSDVPPIPDRSSRPGSRGSYDGQVGSPAIPHEHQAAVHPLAPSRG